MITLENITLANGTPAEVYLLDGNWEQPLALLTENAEGWTGDSSVHMCWGDSREAVLAACLRDWAHVVTYEQYPDFLKKWQAEKLASALDRSEDWQRETMW